MEKVNFVCGQYTRATLAVMDADQRKGGREI
jgi:hypothetical protein